MGRLKRFRDGQMNIGDLVRVKIPADLNDDGSTGFLLYITEVAKTGINVVVLSGPHLGSEYFLPIQNREFEVISENR